MECTTINKLLTLGEQMSSTKLVLLTGTRRTTETGVKELLSIKNVQIVNVKDPEPGTWRVRVSSSSPHTIRVTGLSTTDFSSGFSKYPTRDIRQTTLRPVQGRLPYILTVKCLIIISKLFVNTLDTVQHNIFNTCLQ